MICCVAAMEWQTPKISEFVGDSGIYKNLFIFRATFSIKCYCNFWIFIVCGM